MVARANVVQWARGLLAEVEKRLERCTGCTSKGTQETGVMIAQMS